MLGFWTAERVDYLRAHWGVESAVQIALALDTTKNAVIGKAHRLRLPRPSAIVTRAFQRIAQLRAS